MTRRGWHESDVRLIERAWYDDGVVAGGARARRDKRAANEAAQQNQQQTMGAFNNAWSACMKGRGYTVG